MASILCYGDSNTHGTVPLTRLGQFDRYPPDARWPNVMAADLGPGHEVIAEGLPGRTTVHDDLVEGGRRNGLDVLPAILLSHVPLDLMILMLGTNDLKPRFGVTAFEIARSLERLVLTARSFIPSLDILVVAPADLAPAGALRDVFQDAEDRQENLPRHIAEMAARQGCGYLNACEYVAVSPVDGIHLEPQAHRVLGAAMAQAVRARLDRAA